MTCFYGTVAKGPWTVGPALFLWNSTWGSTHVGSYNHLFSSQREEVHRLLQRRDRWIGRDERCKGALGVEGGKNSRFRYRQFLYVSKRLCLIPNQWKKISYKINALSFLPHSLSCHPLRSYLTSFKTPPINTVQQNMPRNTNHYPQVLGFHHCTSDIFHGTEYYSVRTSARERERRVQND